MLWLAHDGSLNANWLSHYAIRFGSRLPAKQVRALFIEDGSCSADKVLEHVMFLERECALAGVTLTAETLPLRGSVAETLLARIPKGPGSFVLCGTRVRQRNLGFFAGTVAQRLLEARRFNVLAIRVVHPGILGNPHRLLVPVTGHPRGFGSGMPFITLWGADLERVDVLLVQVSPRLGLAGTAFRSCDGRYSGAATYVENVQLELRRVLGQSVQLDAAVVVAADAADEIVLAAKRHRSQLIYLGASERGVAERLVAGTPVEKILRDAPCDVAIYRGVS